MSNQTPPKLNINNLLQGQQSKGKSNKKAPFATVLIQNKVPILLAVNLLFLSLLIFFQFNPPAQVKTDNQRIYDEVREVIDIDDNETPIISKIPDADSLRQTNVVMAEVYKDAKNGDYFIALSDQIIIFRDRDDEVIYQGPSPSQIVEDRKLSLVSTIKNLAQESSITIDANETPELLAASDTDKLKALDGEFYKDVQKNDVIAVFSESEKIIIYRPSTASIVNSGTYSSSIVQ